MLAAEASFAYRHLPNPTDFTVTAKQDILGVKFAMVRGRFDYHATTAIVVNLDSCNEQRVGAPVLPVVRKLATSASLPTFEHYSM